LGAFHLDLTVGDTIRFSDTISAALVPATGRRAPE